LYQDKLESFLLNTCSRNKFQHYFQGYIIRAHFYDWNSESFCSRL